MAIDAQTDADSFSQEYDQGQAAKAAAANPPDAPTTPWGTAAKWVSSLPDKLSTDTLNTALSGVSSMFEGGGFGEAASRVARDVAGGALQGAANVADAAYSGLRSATNSATENLTGVKNAFDTIYPSAPVWDHAKAQTQDFIDAIKVQDPNMVDNLTQFTAQIVPWYLLASRVLGGYHGFANTLVAGAAADAVALPPDAPRTADLLAMLKQTDGKVGAALNAAGPYGLNTYINYLTDRSNETEAQARWKNALDGLLPNSILTGVIHAAGATVKQGLATGRFMADNGIGSLFDMGPPAGSPGAQRGAIGYHGTPHDPDFFDNTKIGTGEGAQLYGHGHYIAENPETAQHYATTLSANGGATAALKLARSTLASSDDARSAVVKLNEMADNAAHPNDKAHYQAAAALVKSGNAKGGVGNIVKVNMADDDVANMMDWDKPMSEQPGVAAKLGPAAAASMTGKDVHRALEKIGMTREQIASELNSAGIPGIKYLDAGSRTGEGEGTRNYVVFDGKRISITGKSKGK